MGNIYFQCRVMQTHASHRHVQNRAIIILFAESQTTYPWIFCSWGRILWTVNTVLGPSSVASRIIVLMSVTTSIILYYNCMHNWLVHQSLFNSSLFWIPPAFLCRWLIALFIRPSQGVNIPGFPVYSFATDASDHSSVTDLELGLNHHPMADCQPGAGSLASIFDAAA